ncbi:MAG: hypothetical protein V1701_02505, partial [Planctomycetota bacterium]
MLNNSGNILALAIAAVLAIFFIIRSRRKKPEPIPIPDAVPVNEWEEYYNNKYPRTDILYNGRKVPWREGRFDVDVRNFFNPRDSQAG